MESLFFLACIVAVGYWFYHAGNRTGSINGFNAGVRRIRKFGWRRRR